jgi:hypothetical protein
LPPLKDAVIVFNQNANQFGRVLVPTSQLDRVAQLGTPPKQLRAFNPMNRTVSMSYLREKRFE